MGVENNSEQFLDHRDNWREWTSLDQVSDPDVMLFRHESYEKDSLVELFVRGFIEVLEPEFYAEYAAIHERHRADTEAASRKSQETGVVYSGLDESTATFYDDWGENFCDVVLMDIKLIRCAQDLQKAGLIPPTEVLYKEADRIANMPDVFYGNNTWYREIKYYLETHLPEADNPRD